MAEDEDCKVYVGSLSFSTTDDSLRNHFESVGEIKDGKEDFEFA